MLVGVTTKAVGRTRKVIDNGRMAVFLGGTTLW